MVTNIALRVQVRYTGAFRSLPDDVRQHIRAWAAAVNAAGAAPLFLEEVKVLYQHVAPVAWMERRSLVIAGLVLLGLSLGWTLLAQGQMASAWRIGIDTHHPTPLIRRGIFRASRNPVFLGMMGTLGGLFLVIPSALSLLVLVLGVVLIQIQVRLEENHLTQLHGETYRQYCREVRRWV